MDQNEKKLNTEPILDDSGTGSAADVEAVMKKYDRESNTRIWTGKPALFIKILGIAFSCWCIFSTLKGWPTLPEQKLNIFVGLILIMGYLHYPIKKGITRANYIPVYDIAIMVVGAFPFFYFAANANTVIQMASRVTKETKWVVLAIIGILALMELCRRSVGIPILCVLGALLVYTFATTRFGKVVYDLFFTTSGVMGTPINVCQKYIVVFIIFGAFLERTGISNFFISLANCVAGSSAGGPAKVAVISSALCGMVSGSSVGNTVTTGSVTIPMMKRTGYKGEFAGAVEAAASTGGQIMPPIMGAAAFLMSEYMGIPYRDVALKAILPAVLYFTGIYIAVHLEAKKLGLRGIPKEELPKFSKLLPKIYLLLPLVVLVVLVSSQARTMQVSAAIAILVTIIVGLINNVVNKSMNIDDPAEKFTVNKFLDALEAGGKSTVTVAVACAMAGLVAGCITTTGLASQLITAIVKVSGGMPIIALFLTMICCIVLGMGVPTTANFCIMASTCAPILMDKRIGIVPVAAYFFVFYFGIVADITPPVALAAYAGSAIAKAPPMKTALNATRLAIAAFVVPYIFAFSPVMLFEFAADATMAVKIIESVLIVVTSLIGLFGIATALNGFLYRPINPLFRVLMAAGGLCMMIPDHISDVVGLVVVGGVIVFQRMGAKKTA
ncbi:MAG: TRAP transporter fused permease subunit [Lawsonibacter sp.]|jgi:TRAP transporter 4TM/12TM fusion protein|nr:TRAP transporter fused permease subunit [Lawsonibacter sp.]MCI9655523.1 TRAP transporter fused permease subunit [Lawsonibacter sp.]